MADCDFTEWSCRLGNLAASTLGNTIDNLATAVMEAFGKTIASLGTIWVNVGTPDLTDSGGIESAISADEIPPNSLNLERVMDYVVWVSLAVAILSLLILGAMIATRMRAGEGVMAVGRVGLILCAVVLISGASALVGGFIPTRPSRVGGAALFLQSALWWYMGATAILSVIVGGARMAWEQRAEPGREVVKSLLTLVVVAGAGVTVVSILIRSADLFSVWIIDSSLDCRVSEAGSTCFGENMLVLLAFTTRQSVGSLGPMLIIILGLIAVLAAAFQVVLMVARSGMLVILTGILPLAASFTNTEMGKGWFKKCVSWLVAFVLYKPAAAIIYATAFQLAGTDVFKDDGSGLLAVLTGLMLMILALFAMPALMRFVTPMVGSMAAGAGGGALAAGALASLPSGAAQLGRLASGSSSGSDGPSGASGRSGSDGKSGTSTQAPTGGGQGEMSRQGQADGAPQSGTAGSKSGGGAGAAGGKGAGTAGAGAGGGSAAAGGGAAGGGAAAGGAAAGGGAAAAGAAAGPIGIAAGVAVDVGKKAMDTAVGAAQSLGDAATGEGGGPDGSR
ncbi:hypothetical protein GZ998_00455 [Actinomyces sp. 594]|uniref:hypothetical protein n=1 Tax=Actinomyces sp. 594 TaxID=2057793 RepID=UPI001C55C254|nr:hypothetical protein [Actinomyces sp. 594]MBW3067989.1 hypothetical protein [Actinomyces sp. 594]